MNSSVDLKYRILSPQPCMPSLCHDGRVCILRLEATEGEATRTVLNSYINKQVGQPQATWTNCVIVKYLRRDMMKQFQVWLSSLNYFMPESPHIISREKIRTGRVAKRDKQIACMLRAADGASKKPMFGGGMLNLKSVSQEDHTRYKSP